MIFKLVIYCVEILANQVGMQLIDWLRRSSFKLICWPDGSKKSTLFINRFINFKRRVFRLYERQNHKCKLTKCFCESFTKQHLSPYKFLFLNRSCFTLTSNICYWIAIPLHFFSSYLLPASRFISKAVSFRDNLFDGWLSRVLSASS